MAQINEHTSTYTKNVALTRRLKKYFNRLCTSRYSVNSVMLIDLEKRNSTSIVIGDAYCRSLAIYRIVFKRPVFRAAVVA